MMIKAYLAVFSAILVWSNAFIAIKIALKELDPFELAAARFVPLVPFYLSYAFVLRRKQSLHLLKSEPVKLIAAALFLIPIYSWLLYKGQEKIAPALTALLVGSSPILSYFLAIFSGQEKFRWSTLAGIACAFLGLSIALWPELGPGSPIINRLYLLCIFGASLSSSVSSVVNHSILKRHSPMTLLALAVPLGCLPLLSAITPELFLKLPRLSPNVWAAILFLSILCTIWGFYAWFYGLEKLPASNVVVFLNLVPIFAMLSGRAFFNEPLTLPLAAGGALVIAGVYQTTRKR